MIYKLANIIPNKKQMVRFINEEKFLIFLGGPMFIGLHYCMYIEFTQQNKQKI
jgi:hypothetical protein